ncbi:MAG: M20/M25/M40 family metallo-hydrolase [Ignavibacteriae bacterium]|nr:M20/M25/M40 family metallo-hydrolase [Ignavibacteria bacterium]MBI3365793.1 M20/M25/M40 family metallo-hydrolase [Ignavibacteriota bacterium]
MKVIIPFALSLYALVASSASAQESINQADIERIVRTLAADSMEGRASFTPGNTNAAAFIQQEFAMIGLNPLDGYQNLRQDIPMYSIKPSRMGVSVNGKPIEPEHILIRADREQVTWTEKDSVEIFYIFEGDNFSAKIGEILHQGVDALVMVDGSHRDLFQEYREYFVKGSVYLEPGKEKTLIAILGAAVEPHRYSIHVMNSVETKTLTNVIGMLSGRRRETVIFSAHYDHIGILTPVKGDSIANGADDDASGVSAVISLAKHFKMLGQPERTLVFVAFAAEEMGGFGSQYFSQRLISSSVVAMFNIEMIGTPSKFGPSTYWMTGFDLSSLGRIVQKNLEGTPYKLYPDPYPKEHLFNRSDNAKLARFGVPAHSFSTTQIDIDKLYHTVGDEAGTLDFVNLTNIVRAIATGAKSIVSGIETPSRIDTSKLK